MPSIIDTNRDTSRQLIQLRAAGVETIIRYYARAMSGKVIRRAEALAIGGAGIRLAIVYEGAGDRLSAFSEEIGFRDAAFSRSYGDREIKQPAGSAVYFAVDFDATAAEIRNAIIPYFRGVARAFADGNGLPVYRVGVYGSGAVCAAVLDAGLAELAWVSCSTGWSGSRAFLQSGRWTLRQHLPSTVAGLDADPDERNPQHPDIGDFLPGALASPPKPPPVIVVPANPPARRFERLLRVIEQLPRMFGR
jgi:Domain of unknown function (DUF1906)